MYSICAYNSLHYNTVVKVELLKQWENPLLCGQFTVPPQENG